MKIRKVCILGGTGFVGRHLAARLANSRYLLRVLTRRRERHKQLLVLPGLELIEADILDLQTLRNQFSGCDAVINLVGTLNGAAPIFRALHVELPKHIVNACQDLGIDRLLHMSALNADAEHGPSLYLRTKGEGEQAAHRGAEHGIQVTSFRPSVIFGPDDKLFNRFAGLLKLSPVLPLACSHARFAPVAVMDVVHAFEVALTEPSTVGKGFELCGPRIYTLRELVEYTAKLIRRRRLIVNLPDNLAQLQAKVLEHVPGQPFTEDNYLSLQVDSVCRSDGMVELGITSHSVEAIMPVYFKGGPRSHYNIYRKVSRHG